ncbi:MAG: transcriptional regulator [Candidatus Micrarchaeaceae archaeon]
MMATIDGKYNSLPSSLDRKLRRVLLYARISVLAMLDYYREDGVSYQDIKDALKLADGSLGPNLRWLKEHGYVESKEEKVEDKAIVVYYITESGKEACSSVKTWLDNIFIHTDKKEKT